MKYDLTVVENADPADTTFIHNQLDQYNLLHAEDDHHQMLSVFARNEAGELIGGLLGGTYWGWLHIDILWVRADTRQHGLGKQLMHEAETEALRRGCKHAHVDTHDFQAPDFYLHLGYSVWGILDDLPPGHQRIFYRKDLG